MMVRGDGRTGPTGPTGPPATEGTSRRRVHTQVTHPARTIIVTDSADAPGPVVGHGAEPGGAAGDLTVVRGAARQTAPVPQTPPGSAALTSLPLSPVLRKSGGRSGRNR